MILCKTFINNPILAFPADIGKNPASPVRGSRQRLQAGESRLRRYAYTPANETDLVFFNMAALVRIVPDMLDNPKTLNLSGVYIYNFQEEKC